MNNHKDKRNSNFTSQLGLYTTASDRNFLFCQTAQ